MSPLIRRIPKDEEENRPLGINASASDIQEAKNKAVTRFMSLQKNRESVFGKLLQLKADPLLNFTQREMDIVTLPSALRSYITGASGFMKVELAAKLRGKARQNIMQELIYETLSTLEKHTKGYIEIRTMLKVQEMHCTIIGSSNARSDIIISVTANDILCEKGNFKTPEEISAAIGSISAI